MNIPLFKNKKNADMFNGDTDIFPRLKNKQTIKPVKVVFFSDTVKVRSFTLCMTVTLLWVYIFITAFMTLTLF